MLKTICLPVTPFSQNARLLYVQGSQECVAVDPGGDAEQILSLISKHSLKLEQIWLTHSHLDHCGAAGRLKAESGARLFGHKAEEEFRSHVEDFCGMYGIPPGMMENCPEPDVYLAGGESLLLGQENFEVLFTPGHSPGHLCFYNSAAGCVITGDTLFASSIGRTDLPGGDYHTLMRSLKEVILALPGSTTVMSGHGPDTKIEIERQSNPFLS